MWEFGVRSRVCFRIRVRLRVRVILKARVRDSMFVGRVDRVSLSQNETRNGKVKTNEDGGRTKERQRLKSDTPHVLKTKATRTDNSDKL